MRVLAIMLLAACGREGHTNVDASPPDGPAPVDHLEVAGACGAPLGPAGEIRGPDTAAGVQVADLAFLVKNTGERALDSLAWTVEGPDAADFTVEPPPSSIDPDPEACQGGLYRWQLGVGRSCRVDVRFAPTTTGDKRAALRPRTVCARSPCGPPANLTETFELRATAIAPPSRLLPSTARMFLKPRGVLSRRDFRIVNEGTTTVAIGTLLVTGPFDAQLMGCPAQLTAGGACDGSVTFATPTVPGCRIGGLSTTTGAFDLPLAGPSVPSTVQLDVVRGSGHVLFSPSGAVCTSSCTRTFDVAGAMTLTATPEAGGRFLGWSTPAGEPALPCGSAPDCPLPAGRLAVRVNAAFASAQAKAIAVTIRGAGTVTGPSGRCTASCTLYAEPGEAFVLTASTGGTFVGWSGDCLGSQAQCNLGTIVNDRAVTATFSP